MSECDKYQEMISQMLDGELPEPHKTELVKHLGCCPDCRRVYDAFSAISLSLGETAAPEGFAGDVMAAVRTQGVHGSGRSKAPGKSLARYLALAACLVLAVLATVRLALRRMKLTPATRLATRLFLPPTTARKTPRARTRRRPGSRTAPPSRSSSPSLERAFSPSTPAASAQ